MKRAFVLFITFSMAGAVAVAGCGRDAGSGSQERDSRDLEEHNEQIEQIVEDIDTRVATAQSSEESSSASELPADDEISEETIETHDLSWYSLDSGDVMGYYNDDRTVYTNEGFGFTLTSDDRFFLVDDEYLTELIGLVGEAFDSENMDESLSRVDAGEDVFVADLIDSDGIGVGVQICRGMLYGDINSNLDEIAEQYETMALDYYDSCEATVETLSFSGTQLDCIRINGVMMGTELYQVQVYFQRAYYYSVVTFTARDEADLQTVLDLLQVNG